MICYGYNKISYSRYGSISLILYILEQIILCMTIAQWHKKLCAMKV